VSKPNSARPTRAPWPSIRATHHHDLSRGVSVQMWAGGGGGARSGVISARLKARAGKDPGWVCLVRPFLFVFFVPFDPLFFRFAILVVSSNSASL